MTMDFDSFKNGISEFRKYKHKRMFSVAWTRAEVSFIYQEQWMRMKKRPIRAS